MPRNILFQVAMANDFRKTFIHVTAKTEAAAIEVARADPSNSAYTRFQARVSKYSR